MANPSVPLRCYTDVEAETKTANRAAPPNSLAGLLADGEPAAPREITGRYRAELLRYATTSRARCTARRRRRRIDGDEAGPGAAKVLSV